MSVNPPRRSNLPEDFEELDFAVVDERWNEYELSDGNRVKGRIILKKIVRDPNNPNNFSINSQPPIYVVYAPITNRGERNNEPTPQEWNTLPRTEIRINRSDEPFNVYRILRTGQTLRLKLTVLRISRVVNRYDNDGMPFYVINSGPMFVADPPPPPTSGQ